jgi:N6-adenosine-specific RNA methylase IME4
MYSTEHVLFGKRGSLKLLKLGERLDFTAPTTGHSRKPDKFYDIVKTVSPGPRIDVFSREKRDGFDQFGNEKDKFNGDKLAA